jgi:hypothetical protein
LKNSFKDETHYGATLYVPDESLGKYKSDIPWGEFHEVLPLSSRPDTHIIASGSCGKGLTWTLDSNGVLTIKGSGAMDSWGKPGKASAEGKRLLPTEDPSAPWAEYLDDILYIVIEEGVTSIGNNAFNGCTNLQSITCQGTNPPAVGTDAFAGVGESVEVFVPESAVDAYNDAAQWKDFDVEASEQTPTAIDQITNDQSSMTNKVIENGHLYILHNGTKYNVQGVRIDD